MNLYSYFLIRPTINAFPKPLLQGLMMPGIQILILAGAVLLGWKAWQAQERRDAKRNFILREPGPAKKKRLSFSKTVRIFSSFLLLLLISIVSVGFVNLLIRLQYSQGLQMDWYVLGTNPSVGSPFQDFSMATILRGIIITALYFFKTMYLLPGLWKLWVNRNPEAAFARTAWVAKLSGVFVGGMLLLQIVNDYDVYFQFSFFAAWFWLCAVVTFIMVWGNVSAEIDRLRERKPLLTLSGFVREGSTVK